jgi:hypothetical protein
MFKTDDRLVQICLGICYFIAAMYAMINFFNPDYLIDRYGTLDATDTNRFFLGWYGMMNFGFVAGLIYMGYKGLDRAFFTYAVPLAILFLIWGVSGQMAADESDQNYTAVGFFVIQLIAIIIARARAFGMNFDFTKADNMWGTSDKLCQTILWLGLATQAFFVVGYFINPSQLITDTPGLELNEVSQRFATGVMYFSIAWTIALLYQLRTGYSMSLIVTGLITSIMFFAVFLNFAAAGLTSAGGEMNTLLVSAIIGNFVGSLILFFRLQGNH